MFRMFSAAMTATAALLSLSTPVSAASDITTAVITTGRLYVIGTTERPHTTVVLDERFDTESDDNGIFEYNLVYHPASCIVAATIEGVTHEAVVGNCGQQVMPGTWLEPHAATEAPALLRRLTTANSESASASFCHSGSPVQSQEPADAKPTVPAPPLFIAAGWANLWVQNLQPPQFKEQARSGAWAAN
jgi:hypothetical protein